MTKTKSQLRAEAVERLRQLNCMDVDCYQLLEAAVDDAGEKVGYRVEINKLINLLTDDAHESRGSYEERLYDVPVSDCPYCGCKRVVIHDFSDIYENPHSYRVEHIDEKEAFEAGCFETYYAFDSAEKAVEHANMRDLLTDEPMDARRDSDGTCPIDDRTVSNHSKNAPTLSDLYGILGGENVPETPDFAENPQKTEFKERESAPSDELPEGDAADMLRKYVEERESANGKAGTYGKRLLQIADMVERDYVSREVYDDLREEFTWETTFLHRMGKKCGTKDVPSLVAYVDKLEAERDELKRQLGTVSAPSGNLDAQARAEIEDAERSRAVSGDFAATVDAGTGGMEKTPQEPREGGIITFTDTREMLEEDVRQILHSAYMLAWMHGRENRRGSSFEKLHVEFYNLLDRQAAITEMKMQAKVDALEAEKRECMEDCANRVSAALVERDRYREKLGRALDAAHEVVRIMEVER